MVSWVYNLDGTVSFETFEYGTITVGAGYVVGDVAPSAQSSLR